MANSNESFPSINTISPENRTLLEETFGSYNPEGQPTLPNISLEDGELVVPTIQIQTDLLPDDQEIFFSEEPIDFPTIFTTSEGEVGLGIILPLESLHFQKGSPWDDSLSGYIAYSLLVRFEQSEQRNGYNLCRLISSGRSSSTKEMIDNNKNGFHTEFTKQTDLDELEFVEEATGYDLKKIYISNIINRIVKESPENYSALSTCVLMYLE